MLGLVVTEIALVLTGTLLLWGLTSHLGDAFESSLLNGVASAMVSVVPCLMPITMCDECGQMELASITFAITFGLGLLLDIGALVGRRELFWRNYVG